MPTNRRAIHLVAVLLTPVVVGMLAAALHFKKNSDALWQIVSEKCLPHQQSNGDPAPCQRVDQPHRYAMLKDMNGSLQYLLIPLDKITGIESPLLLQPATPNYFALAWHERTLLAQRRGSPIDDRVLSLAINSQYGRTQNQLHIHLSCLRPDVRQQLDQLTPQLGGQWQELTLRKHRYWLRALTTDELSQQSAFIRLADEKPQARTERGKYGLALAELSDGRLVLMAIERNWMLLNSGSAEELQDHACQLIAPIKKAA
ncbi:CDP-diacylglycerol diphosphatase [Pantoea vagans]|uniref:CDP-diacylglycerol diphosphatase n=1 Tax=Pantoea vagans TaxID=470934 RepID=UPI0023B16DA3|nr:CDP-diacylglycerol diphosphatase [Pantoea vagans]MDE8558784.1 CDP-diacylglycerol diphosphatase [Pantoea vagans]MDE8578789.1 CDP-diacylglycerol diphosphatase [Pantoea vagans]